MVVLVASVVAVLFAESLYRIRTYGWAGLSPAYLNSMRSLGRSGLLRAAEGPHLRYQLAPDLDVLYKLVPFRTNAQGLRDEPASFEKAADTFRIAVVGDSFTMGTGVVHEELYATRLEELLSVHGFGGKHRVECLNFGVGGYGLRSYLGVLTDRLPRWKPDLVLLALTNNDKFVVAREAYERPWRDMGLEPAPFWRLNLLELLAPPADRERTRSSKAGFEVLRELFVGLAEAARALEAPLVVVYLNTWQTKEPLETGLLFASFAERLRLPYLDTSPTFAGRTREEVEILPNDAHPNALAHRLFAEDIARFLEGLAPGQDRDG